MRLYPNRSQWITIWLTTAAVVAALGRGERRAPVAYAVVGALLAWSQAKSPGKSFGAVAVKAIVTILVLLAAVILIHPKPAP